MRIERSEEPNEADAGKRGHNGQPRPRRRAAGGPLGFGSVMRDVKGQTPGKPGALTPGSPDFDRAAYEASKLSAGGAAAREMGASQSTEDANAEEAFGVQSATSALAQADASVTNAVEAKPVEKTHLGKMTPSEVINTVLDEATKQEIADASRELHIELHPRDLGPLVVEVKRDDNGKLDIRFRTREAEAARVLDAGSDMLRERLADAGFGNAEVRVRHDVELVFDFAD